MEKLLNILLLGKTGSGKSSAGNSILGSRCFGTGASVDRVESSEAEVQGRVVKVVDTPSLSDPVKTIYTPEGKTIHKSEEGLAVPEIMERAFNICPSGFSACLLVFKFQNCPDQQTLSDIRYLKEVFGENFLKEHCIVVITHGDVFEQETREGHVRTFEEWCEEQADMNTAWSRELIQECQNRVVLFDNMAPQKGESVDKVLTWILGMSTRYTKDMFDHIQSKDMFDHIQSRYQNGFVNMADGASNKSYENGGFDPLLDHQTEEKTNTEDMYETIKDKKRRFTLVASVFSGASALICTCVLIFVIVTFVSDSSPGVAHKANAQTETVYTEVCIPCLKLIKNPYRQSDPDALLDDLTKRYEDGVLKCCASNHSQISAVLEAMLREQDTAPVRDLDLTTASVSVHKMMKYETSPGTGPVKQNVLKFDPNITNQLTEHIRGVSVTEDGLIIQHTGLYFLYCSVYFRSQHFDIKIMYSYIHRTRPNGPSGVLLKTAHTSCESCKQDNETAFTGLTVVLMMMESALVTLNDEGSSLSPNWRIYKSKEILFLKFSFGDCDSPIHNFVCLYVQRMKSLQVLRAMALLVVLDSVVFLAHADEAVSGDDRGARELLQLVKDFLDFLGKRQPTPEVKAKLEVIVDRATALLPDLGDGSVVQTTSDAARPNTSDESAVESTLRLDKNVLIMHALVDRLQKCLDDGDKEGALTAVLDIKISASFMIVDLDRSGIKEISIGNPEATRDTRAALSRRRRGGFCLLIICAVWW